MASKTDILLSKSTDDIAHQVNDPVFNANHKGKDTKPIEELTELHCSKRGRPIRLGKVHSIRYITFLNQFFFQNNTQI